MNAVVLGNGRSGRAAAELLLREGWSVRILDGDEQWPNEKFDLCVTSPGVAIDHVWQKSAEAESIKIISELQLGAERYKALGGSMLAVTGSKGKSSVVKLVADAVGGVACGNYGKPLCEVVLEAKDFTGKPPDGEPDSDNGANGLRLPPAVVEVSSFQMERTQLPGDAFIAAAVLNLQEDHLDRHGSVEVYHNLKLRLLDFAIRKISGASSFDEDEVMELLKGSYFDNAILRENGGCAVALMRSAGLSDESIRTAFLNFEALPHRMQTIAVRQGVKYIDDSKATSISALAAGVEMANGRVRLIAGGLAKGDDPVAAREAILRNVVKVYLIGRCAGEFENAWKDIVPCELCETLDVAVSQAKRDSQDGDCVLLSPGTASFDQFKSYSERGDKFAEFVKKQ
jgi:UDP-N-acetylmuramoylalanine--D-glutamate ligase